MSAVSELAPPTARWDLSVLFDSIDDPRIERHWQESNRRADAFAEKYRGKINSPDLTAETLLQSLQEIEALSQDAGKPIYFAHLIFAADTGNPEHGAFLQKQQELGTQLSVKLMFYELELQAAPEEVIGRLLADDRLAGYRHHVKVSRAFSPYRLSEPEEIILEEAANSGSRAWVRLFEELVANHTFKLHRPGKQEEETLSLQETLTLMRDPDREVRKAGADALSSGLNELQRVLVFTYNTLIQDKATEDRLRGIPYPEHTRHLSNELDKETVDKVMGLCREYQGMVARFYNVKREILGLDTLTHYDRYAPLFPTNERVSYEEAQEIILDAFGTFSTELRERGAEFFEKSWIDAEPRKGKQGGAFCSSMTPDTHPVLFLSYLNKMDDVTTLAHELGHGVHGSLARKQTYFNFHGTLPLAELASTFAEMLVFEKLVSRADLKDKLALHAEKIEGIFSTIFRQAALFRFEQRAHETRRAKGELTAEEFGDIWQEELQSMFSNSVQLGEQHRDWWSYVSHFIHAPFYVYAYSFGELLVLAVYEMAKHEGPAFAEKYVNLLSLGGSMTPFELMQTVGVDLKDERFWRNGFEALERLIVEFERLWAEYRQANA